MTQPTFSNDYISLLSKKSTIELFDSIIKEDEKLLESVRINCEGLEGVQALIEAERGLA